MKEKDEVDLLNEKTHIEEQLRYLSDKKELSAYEQAVKEGDEMNLADILKELGK